jgi:hypothetical protein
MNAIPFKELFLKSTAKWDADSLKQFIFEKSPFLQPVKDLLREPGRPGLRLRSAPSSCLVPEPLGERSRTRSRREPCLFPKILTIQKIGNLAVHSDKPISINLMHVPIEEPACQ